MAGRLENKVALITGGASGIGEATVRLFAAEGARVVICDVQPEPGLALAKDLGDVVRFQETDVREEAQVAAAVDLAVSEFGRLDCLFANAGIVGCVGPIDEMPMEEWDFTLSVNLRGAIVCMKHAARVMKPQRSGVILSTSSIAAIRGGLGPHAYTATKAALQGITRNLAAELGPDCIRVNCIAPGNMATEMIAGLVFSDTSKVDLIAEGLANSSPLPGRAGLPTDIASTALYLASEEGGYVSGQTLVVDGGLTSGPGDASGAVFSSTAPMVREAGRRGLPGS